MAIAMPLADTVPLLVAALFAAAIEIVRRHSAHAAYAKSWSIAFALIAAGWFALIPSALSSGLRTAGAASSLCWFGAALLLVHGLQLRSGRPDRHVLLASIWLGMALLITSSLDLLGNGPAAHILIAMLVAMGLVLAAAIVVQARRLAAPDWLAATLLTAASIGAVVIALGLTGGPMMGFVLPIAATLVSVAIGLAMLVLINGDLTIRLERVARTDPLTGIWNRRGFDEAAPFLIDGHKFKHGACAAVAIADIDAFKEVNDRHGHTVGDAVLVNFAKALATAVEKGDFLARLGGEEFAVLAIGCDSATLLDRIERVRAGICMPNAQREPMPSITASFGVAEFCAQSWSVRDALERADHALYRAKREGRNRCVMGAPPRTTH